MAGITLAQAEAKLATWLDAEDKVAAGQAYSIGGRSLTRADLKNIADRVEYWDNKVKSFAGSGGPAFNVGIRRRNY